MKRLEQQVIEAMRLAIAHYHTDSAAANREYSKAHDLWSGRLMRWSDDFAQLYDHMMEIWRAYTPQPKGRYVTKRVVVSIHTHPFVQRWVKDKVQPPVPTTEELLSRFDRLISAYASAHPEPSPSKSRKREKGLCRQQAELWPD